MLPPAGVAAPKALPPPMPGAELNPPEPFAPAPDVVAAFGDAPLAPPVPPVVPVPPAPPNAVMVSK